MNVKSVMNEVVCWGQTSRIRWWERENQHRLPGLQPCLFGLVSNDRRKLLGTMRLQRSVYDHESWPVDGTWRDEDPTWVQPKRSSKQLQMCEYNKVILYVYILYALVVPNCVFRRLPSIPCTPRLALMKAKPTKDNAFVQAGSSRASDMLGCAAFQNAIAPAIVKRAWMNVPAMSHIRLCAPTRSPIRPTKAPRLKLIKEHNACWSALWNVWSWNPGAPSKRRASAIANYREDN